MSKWLRVKIAALAGSALLFHLGGCGIGLGGLSWDRIMPLVAVGSIFD